MPLPLIVAAGAAVASAVGGVIAMLDAKERIKIAREKYERHREEYLSAERLYNDTWRREANARFETLGQRRLKALTTLGRAVDFLKKAKIRDRDLEQRLNITPQKLAEWKNASVNAAEVLGGMGRSVSAGAATAAGVYGTVGVLGTASTGTAIGTLSGAAAKSATLAWLGGGSVAAGGGGVAAGTMVLGGFVVGPALLVAGLFASSKAEKVETEVEQKIAEMDIAEVQIEQQIATVKIVLRRVDELHEATDKVDRALQSLLNSGDPVNLENAYEVAQTAESLGKLLDVSLADKNGNITLN